MFLQKFKDDIVNTVANLGLQRAEAHEITNINIACSDPNINNCTGPFLHTTTVIYRGCPLSVTGEVYFCPDLMTGNTYISIGNITEITYDWFYNPDCTIIL